MSTWDSPTIGPQPGPQTAAIRSTVDVLVYGGAAGGGKTAALLLKPLYHVGNKDFKAILFRREYGQLMAADGLVDESRKIYPKVGGKLVGDRWTFPSGATIDFYHCEVEKDAEKKFQGVQVAFIGVDEATTATEHQLHIMMTRLRSSSGVKPQIMMTANPKYDHCIARWLKSAGYVDKTGYAVAEMSGAVRYYINVNKDFVFGESPNDFPGRENDAKSFTFIPSKVTDNKILLQTNPEYEKNLRNTDDFMRSVYYDGNWNATPSGGTVMKRPWFLEVYNPPIRFEQVVRAWDLASTTDGDYTVGVLMGRLGEKLYIIDVQRFRKTTHDRNSIIKATGLTDRQRYPNVKLVLERQPGGAGNSEVAYLGEEFKSFGPEFITPRGDKVQRIQPFASLAEQGQVFVLQSGWTEAYLSELVAFPQTGIHDDQVDATSLAESKLRNSVTYIDSAFAARHGVKALKSGKQPQFKPIQIVEL